MVIEQSEGGPVVVGRQSSDTKAETEAGTKRDRDEIEAESSSKRLKVAAEPGTDVDHLPTIAADSVQESGKGQVAETRRSKGDVFLAHGVREQLQNELNVCHLLPISIHFSTDS